MSNETSRSLDYIIYVMGEPEPLTNHGVYLPNRTFTYGYMGEDQEGRIKHFKFQTRKILAQLSEREDPEIVMNGTTHPLLLLPQGYKISIHRDFANPDNRIRESIVHWVPNLPKSPIFIEPMQSELISPRTRWHRYDQSGRIQIVKGVLASQSGRESRLEKVAQSA